MTVAAAQRELGFGPAINEALRQEMQRDPRVIVMGVDVAGAGGRAHLGLMDAWGGPMRATRGLIAEFGAERVIDTPISEMGFVGAAVGAAMTGLRPVVEVMFIDLIGVCYDQIINQAAKMHYMNGGNVNLPMVIRTTYGTRGDKRSYGGGAAAQHSQTLYATLAHVPQEPYTLPIGKAEVVRKGKDVTLVGIGRMTHVCLEAADVLANEDGLSAEVIDMLTIAPMDEATLLESVSRTHRMVVADEDHAAGSMARDIAARVMDQAFDYLDAPIKTVTAPDTPVPFAAVLEALYTPRAEQVVAAVRAQIR